MSSTAGNLTAARLRYCTSNGCERMLPASLQHDILLREKQTCLSRTYMGKVQHVPTQGMGVPGQRNLGLLQRQDLAAAAPVKRVLEALELFELMETLLQVSKHRIVAPVGSLASA